MDAHAREAAAAEAAMAEFYGTWRPAEGQRVRCPLAWGGGSQEGTVICQEGRGWLVDTAEGRLQFFAAELEVL
jgi:hypothetical protein